MSFKTGDKVTITAVYDDFRDKDGEVVEVVPPDAPGGADRYRVKIDGMKYVGSYTLGSLKAVKPQPPAAEEESPLPGFLQKFFFQP